jgi:hypothetical protein
MTGAGTDIDYPHTLLCHRKTLCQGPFDAFAPGSHPSRQIRTPPLFPLTCDLAERESMLSTGRRMLIGKR